MSVNIRIQNAVKKYGDNVVIPDLSLDIKEGEFFTLPREILEWFSKTMRFFRT